MIPCADNGKTLLIHDLPDRPDAPEGVDMIDAGEIDRHCIGCFGCWTRTPAACVIRDGFETIPDRFAACEELVIISRCVYGGFSPEVKNVLDRCIGYLLPFFTLREDRQMHHQARYHRRLILSVHLYGGDITREEQETARKLIQRNALNLNARTAEVVFHERLEEIRRETA